MKPYQFQFLNLSSNSWHMWILYTPIYKDTHTHTHTCSDTRRSRLNRAERTSRMGSIAAYIVCNLSTYSLFLLQSHITDMRNKDIWRCCDSIWPSYSRARALQGVKERNMKSAKERGTVKKIRKGTNHDAPGHILPAPGGQTDETSP